MRKGTKMKRVSIAILALVAAALVLVGCGGSSGGSSTGTSTTPTTASSGEGKGGMFNISEEAKACLKEKGVELPGLKGGEGGPPSTGGKPEGGEMPKRGEGGPPGGFGGEGSEEMKKAFEECGVETPGFKGGAGGAGGKPNTNSAAFKKQVNEYVACVRENGYELGEPNFSGEGPIFEKSESESAEFKKASARCQELLGGQGGSQSG
jgi:hypothetical protein